MLKKKRTLSLTIKIYNYDTFKKKYRQLATINF